MNNETVACLYCSVKNKENGNFCKNLFSSDGDNCPLALNNVDCIKDFSFRLNILTPFVTLTVFLRPTLRKLSKNQS